MNMPLEIITENFIFRNYTIISECDSHVLWEARNNECVRCYMENSEPFSYDSHRRFVKDLANTNNKVYYAVYQQVGDNLVASQCINPICESLGSGESGQYLIPRYQGKGLGSLMKKEFLEYIFTHDILQKITEKVKVNNFRNQHLNEKLGFRMYASDEKYIYYEMIRPEK